MPMSPYPVLCACSAPAAFKVAARWSDGTTQELKTYALACASCLPSLFARAVAKREACHLAPGETLDAPGIFDLARGSRDKQLARRADLEAELAASA